VARQLRIEYPGAFYHVTSRGNQKQRVFFSDLNYRRFLDYLAEAHEMHGAIFHGYCLMENHFHFILETPLGNLSQIMHFINTAYSIYLNKSRSRVGHLFQGRFKAILIEAEAYALGLSRYIHMNPVRAKLVQRPEEYSWSSYQDYVGYRRRSTWLKTDFILGHFSRDENLQKLRYESFVLDERPSDVDSLLREIQHSAVLGSPEFIEKATSVLNPTQLRDREIPQINQLRERPDLNKIQIESDRVLGRYNGFTRAAAIFISRNRARYKLREVADYFKMSPSGIVRLCHRIKNILISNETLRQAIQEIEKALFD